MDKTDHELILEYAQGSQTALETLFLRYKDAMFNFALRILGNRADAEDVTGEVFLALLTRSARYEPQAKFSTWLYTVARNACISKVRKSRNWISLWFQAKPDEEPEPIDIPDPKARPDEEAHQREVAREVKRAVQNLPDSQKEALVLREYHDLSYDEIAGTLGCTLENVKILIFRARERLRKTLAPVIKED
jgi:RNA polymerase sigma-70 factor (ECF subfamily)